MPYNKEQEDFFDYLTQPNTESKLKEMSIERKQFFNENKLSEKLRQFTNPVSERFNELSRSIENKYYLMQEKKIDKELDLQGYQKGYLVFKNPQTGEPFGVDGDSGVIQDEKTGQLFKYRSDAWREFDTADYYNDVYNSKYKRKLRVQPRVVAALNGKNINDLTEEDFRNVERYNTIQTLNFLKDPNYIFQKYDKNFRYDIDPSQSEERIPILYKTNGNADVFNRFLTDVVNPGNGKSVFQEYTSNPYMNMRFRISEHEDNEKNREVFNNFRSTYAQKAQDTFNRHNIDIKSFTDSFGTNEETFGNLIDYFGFLKDKVKGSSLQMLSRVMKYIVPGTDKEYWDSLLREDEYGMTLADKISGMDRGQFLKYRNRMLEDQTNFENAGNFFKQGKYSEGSTATVKTLVGMAEHQLDYLADSAAQMVGSTAMMLGGSLLGAKAGALGGPIGAGIGALLGLAASAIFIGTDETLIAMQEYEKKNPGKTMAPDDVISLWGGQIFAAAPEPILQKIGIGKILPKAINTKLFGKEFAEKAIKEFSLPKYIGKAALYEGGQEHLQSTISNYFSQERGENDEKLMSLGDVALDKDSLFEGLAGFMMGGSLGTVSGVSAKVKNTKRNEVLQSVVDEHLERIQNTDIHGQKVTDEVKNDSQAIIELVDKIAKETPVLSVDTVDPNADNTQIVGKTIQKITQLQQLNGKNQTQEAWNKVNKEIANTVRGLIAVLKNEPDSTDDVVKDFLNQVQQVTGVSKEHLFGNIVYFSSLNARNLLTDENEELTDAGRQNEQRQIDEIGQAMGLSNETIKKTMQEVQNELYLGPEGLYIAEDQVTKYKQELEELRQQPETPERNEKIQETTDFMIGSLLRFIRMLDNNVDKLDRMNLPLMELIDNPTTVKTQTYSWKSKEGKGTYASRDNIVFGRHKRTGFYNVAKEISKDVDYMLNKFKEIAPPEIADLITRSMGFNNAEEYYKYMEDRKKDYNDMLEINSQRIYNNYYNIKDANLDQLSEYMQNKRNQNVMNQTTVDATNITDNNNNTNISVDPKEVNKHSNNFLKIIQKDENWKFREQNISDLVHVYNTDKNLWNAVKTRVLEGSKRVGLWGKDKSEDAKKLITEIEQLGQDSQNRRQQVDPEFVKKRVDKLNEIYTEYPKEKIEEMINNSPKNFEDPRANILYLRSLMETEYELKTHGENVFKLRLEDEDVNKKMNEIAELYKKVYKKRKEFEKGIENFNEEKNKSHVQKRIETFFKDETHFTFDGSFEYSTEQGQVLIAHDTTNNKLIVNANKDIWDRAFSKKQWNNDVKERDDSITKGIDVNFASVDDYINYEVLRNVIKRKRQRYVHEKLGDYNNKVNDWALKNLGYRAVSEEEKARIDQMIEKKFGNRNNNNNTNNTNTNTDNNINTNNNTRTIEKQDFYKNIADKYKNNPKLSWLFEDNWEQNNPRPTDSTYDKSKNLIYDFIFKDLENGIGKQIRNIINKVENKDKDYVRSLLNSINTIDSEWLRNEPKLKNNPHWDEKFVDIHKDIKNHYAQILRDFLNNRISINQNNQNQNNQNNQNNDNEEPEREHIVKQRELFKDVAEKYKNDPDVNWIFEKNWEKRNPLPENTTLAKSKNGLYAAIIGDLLDDTGAQAEDLLHGEKTESHINAVKLFIRNFKEDMKDENILRTRFIKDNPNWNSKLLNVYKDIRQKYVDALENYLNNNNNNNNNNNDNNDNNNNQKLSSHEKLQNLKKIFESGFNKNNLKPELQSFKIEATNPNDRLTQSSSNERTFKEFTDSINKSIPSRMNYLLHALDFIKDINVEDKYSYINRRKIYDDNFIISFYSDVQDELNYILENKDKFTPESINNAKKLIKILDNFNNEYNKLYKYYRNNIKKVTKRFMKRIKNALNKENITKEDLYRIEKNLPILAFLLPNLARDLNDKNDPAFKKYNEIVQKYNELVDKLNNDNNNNNNENRTDFIDNILNEHHNNNNNTDYKDEYEKYKNEYEKYKNDPRAAWYFSEDPPLNDRLDFKNRLWSIRQFLLTTYEGIDNNEGKILDDDTYNMYYNRLQDFIDEAVEVDLKYAENVSNNVIEDTREEELSSVALIEMTYYLKKLEKLKGNNENNRNQENEENNSQESEENQTDGEQEGETEENAGEETREGLEGQTREQTGESQRTQENQSQSTSTLEEVEFEDEEDDLSGFDGINNTDNTDNQNKPKRKPKNQLLKNAVNKANVLYLTYAIKDKDGNYININSLRGKESVKKILEAIDKAIKELELYKADKVHTDRLNEIKTKIEERLNSNDPNIQIKERILPEKQYPSNRVINSQNRPAMNIMTREDEQKKKTSSSYLTFTEEDDAKAKNGIFVLDKKEGSNGFEKKFITKDKITDDLWQRRFFNFRNNIVPKPDQATSILAKSTAEFDEVRGDFETILKLKDMPFTIIEGKDENGNPIEGTLRNTTLKQLINASMANYKDYFLKFIVKDKVKDANGNNLTQDPQYSPLNAGDRNFITRYYIEENPMLRVLFEWPAKDGQLDIGNSESYKNNVRKMDFNQDVLSVAFYSFFDAISNNDLSTYFQDRKRVSKDDVLRFFGINPDSNISEGDKAAIKAVFEATGIPINKLRNDFGKKFCENMGWKKNTVEKVYKSGFYEDLCACAGDFMISIGESFGLFNVKMYEPENFNKYTYNHNMSSGTKKNLLYQQNMLSVPKANIARFKRFRDFGRNFLIPRFQTAKNAHYELRTTEKQFTGNEKRWVRKMEGFVLIPPNQLKVIQKLENTKHTLNPVLLEIFESMDENEKLYLESYFKNNFDLMEEDLRNNAALDDRDSNDGKVMTVNQSYQNFLRAVNQKKIFEAENPGKQFEFMFDYFVGSNGRLMMESNNINPQTNKVDRWFAPQVAWYQEWDMSNSKHVALIKFALFQGFDALAKSKEEKDAIFNTVSSWSEEHIIKVMKDICTKGIVETFNEDENKYEFGGELVSLEVENVNQVMQIFAHLLTAARNKNEDGTYKKFKSYLAVENDATTSGYAIKLLNMPLYELYKDYQSGDIKNSWYAKVGILFQLREELINATAMHMIKSLDGFLDIYRSSAALASENLPNNFVELAKAENRNYETMTKEEKEEFRKEVVYKRFNDYFNSKDNTIRVKNNYVPNSKLDTYDQHTQLYLNLADSLPTIEIIDGIPKVTAALRLLLKPAVMVFNYTAGLHNISVQLANELWNKTYVTSYLRYIENESKTENDKLSEKDLADKLFSNTKIKENRVTKLRSVIKTFEYLSTLLNEDTKQYEDQHGNIQTAKNLAELLQNKSADSIVVEIDGTKMSLFQAFEGVIEATYGKAVWNGLSEVFGAYKAINDSLNDLGALQYTNYRTNYENMLHDIRQDFSTNPKKIHNGVKYEYDVPESEITRLRKELKPLFPAIDMYYSDQQYIDNNQIGLLNRERDVSNSNMRTGLKIPTDPSKFEKLINEDGTIKLVQPSILRPEIYRIASPKKKTAVLGIHGIDGTQMSLLIDFMYDQINTTVLGVHDAIVSSAMHSEIAPYAMNAITLLVNRNYDSYFKILDRTVNNVLYDILVYNNKSDVSEYMFGNNNIVENIKSETNIDIKSIFENFYSKTKEENKTYIEKIEAQVRTKYANKTKGEQDSIINSRREKILEQNKRKLLKLVTDLINENNDIQGLKVKYSIIKNILEYEKSQLEAKTNRIIELLNEAYKNKSLNDRLTTEENDYNYDESEQENTDNNDNESKEFKPSTSNVDRYIFNVKKDSYFYKIYEYLSEPKQEEFFSLRKDLEKTIYPYYQEVRKSGEEYQIKSYFNHYDIFDKEPRASHEISKEKTKPNGEKKTQKYKVFDNKTDILTTLTRAMDIYTKEIVYYDKNDKEVRTNEGLAATRNFFYTQIPQINIANTDGAEGSMFRTTPQDAPTDFAFSKVFQEKIKELARKNNIYFNSPRGFVTNGQKRILLDRAQKDPKARIELLRTVNDMSQSAGLPTSSEEELKHFEKLFSSFNPSRIEDLQVTLENSDANAGSYNPRKKEVRLGIDSKSNHIDPVTRYSIYTDSSLASILGHEYVHAGTDFAFDHAYMSPTIYRSREALREIQKRVMKEGIFTEDTFMPDNYDANSESIYRDRAKEYISYIYSEDSILTDKDAHLKEFVAVSLTHSKAMKTLANTPSMLKADKNLFELMTDLVKAIFDVLFKKNGDFKNVTDTFNKIVNYSKFKQSQSLLDDMKYLVLEINKIDRKAANALDKHPLSKVSNIFGYIENYIHSGNIHLRNAINLITNFAKPIQNAQTNLDKKRDALFHYMRNQFIKGATERGFAQFKGFLLAVATASFSKEGRRALKDMIMPVRQAYIQGAVSAFWSDFTKGDMDTQDFETLNLQTSAAYQSTMALINVVRSDLEAAFTKDDMKQDKLHSLTKAVLMTDVQSLYGEGALTSNIEELKDIIANDNKIKTHIDNIIQDINDSIDSIQVSNSKERLREYVKNWINNQAIVLGIYMATGIGCENLNTNANNIAALTYLSYNFYDYKLDKNKEVVKKIDQLATLVALYYTNPNERKLIKTISNKGLRNFINTHKQFVEESENKIPYINNNLEYKEEALFNDVTNGYDHTHISNMQKGYIKRLYNQDIESKLGFSDAATKAKLKSEGDWDFIEEVKSKYSGTNPNLPTLDNKGTKFGVYVRRSYRVQDTVDGASYIMQGSRTMGINLFQAAEAYEDDTTWKQLKLDSYKRSSELNKIFLNTRPELHKLVARIKKVTNHALPIARNNMMSDKGNLITNPMDFRYTGSHDLHINVLEMDTDAITVLSKMFGYNNTKSVAYQVNDILTKHLLQYQYTHMDIGTKQLVGNKHVKFVQISPKSSNEEVRKRYKEIPNQIKEIAKLTPLYIREDWVHSFLGVQSFSLGDYVEEKLPKTFVGKYKVKKFVQILELLSKLTSVQTKKLIVIGKPVVLLYNIISNYIHTVTKFHNPVKAFTATISNFKNISDYINTRNKYYELMWKKRKKIITQEEQKSIKWYKAKLENNPVAPLVKAGMFQNIVEDIKQNDLDMTGRPYKFLKKLGVIKKLQDLPQVVQIGGSWLWRNATLANSSGIYKLLYSLTQYSDFASRATEYQFMMDPNYQIAKRDRNGNVTEYKKIPEKYDSNGALNPDWVRYEKNVKNNVLMNFINYDRPQSRLEQYLNDIGLIMFSKFAKRIQPVILDLIKHHPIESLMMLITQSMLVNTEDVFEQQLFFKNWSALVHSPIDNAISSLTPWGVSVLTGETELFPSLTKPL